MKSSIENNKDEILKIIKDILLTNNTINFPEQELNKLLFSLSDILNIFKLFYSDYTIFLNNKFFSTSKYYYNFKKNLLEYFNKYNIVYFNYSEKNKIINLINLFNNFIKNSTQIDQNKLILQLLKIDEDNTNFFYNTKKLKQIFFSENIIEPSVLYKKIQFSNQEIYTPFSNYIIKKMEYKLRTFCQIAEKLGAEKIIIEYYSSTTDDKELNLSLDIFSASVGTNIINKNSENETIKIIFEYPNNHSDINLNKFYIINSILNENEFLISKDEFESDLELKFLIDTRCINFIQKYHTNFIINHINKIEQKIFLKAQNYGLNIGNMNLKNNFIKISITIDFIQIQNNIDIIDGTNIHILREGFTHLSNIIKKDKDYSKLLRFLYSHLTAIEKRWVSLNYVFDNIDKINNIYNDIVNLNFKESEMCSIIEKYFNNNLTWDNFKKFRDIILKGSDYNLEKIYFVTFQYHDIINNKKHIMYDIEKYIEIYFNKYIDDLNNTIKYSIDSNNSNNKLLKYSQDLDDIFDMKYIINNRVRRNTDELLECIVNESSYNINEDPNNINEVPNNINITKYIYDVDKKYENEYSLDHTYTDVGENNLNYSPTSESTLGSKKKVFFERDTKHTILSSKKHIKPNIINMTDSFNNNNDDNNNNLILYEFLIKNKRDIIKIIYLSFKKSFNFNNGLSDNIINIEKLNFVIKNIINYYFDNDIKNLQLTFNNLFNNYSTKSSSYYNNLSFYGNANLDYNSFSDIKDVKQNQNFNLKKNIFDNLIDKICIEIIQNKNLNLSDSSPNIETLKKDIKLSLFQRTQKIFLKFIIKYFDFENKTELIINKLRINIKNTLSGVLEPILLVPFLDKYIAINKVYKNYNKYKLFYTWEDFIIIKNYFLD